MDKIKLKLKKVETNTMRWGDKATLEFVKLYLKHECLWNPGHPSYKNRLDRNKAYYTIYTEFEAFSGKAMTVPEIKVKIKNLRSTYAQQVHRIMHESGPDGMYQPSLVWFNEMDRCLKNIPQYVRPSIVSEYRESVTDIELVEEDTWTKTESEQNEESEELNPDPLVSEEDYSYRSTIKKKNIYKKSKRRKYKRSSPYYSTSNNEERYVEVRNMDDEFEIYGKFIAAQLRQMDLQKALKLQLEIQSLVSEARISDLA